MSANPPDPADRDRPRKPKRDTPPPDGKDAGGTPAERTPAETEAGSADRDPVPFTQILGRITLVILAVLFGVFAVANAQPVAFSWVFGATEVRADPTGDGDIGGVPLIILLGGSFVIGAAVGMLLEWQLLRGRRRRREAG